MNETCYWLAVNGPSVAFSGQALPQPKVIPTPEMLLGFRTKQEALETQKFLLAAPIRDCQRKLDDLGLDTTIRIIRLKHPEGSRGGGRKQSLEISELGCR
jgi:hypothetical protein